MPDEDTLPELRGRDEARLLVQSPELLFLYWNFAHDPHATLLRALGEAPATRYSLAVRLFEIESGRERLHGAGAGQTIWLEARPGKTYRAEIGFHSSRDPFVRLLASNEARTPPGKVSAVLDLSEQLQPAGGDALLVLSGSGGGWADVDGADATTAADSGAAPASSSYVWPRPPS
jgi:hypothetical protein